MSDGVDPLVEVRPEVVFLYEILSELSQQRIRIPRFQREFVWRREQMTELLDSINKQYPVGSLLVWETSQEISTLDRMGPFVATGENAGTVGYLLDGHQRLMTLAAALLPGSASLERLPDVGGGKWEMYWNVKRHRFQHKTAADAREHLFPLTSLLDTMRFFEEISSFRERLGSEAAAYVNEISTIARTFQAYRIPVIRMRQTGLSEAVEIFARLNSRGQSMSADQMVSALTYRQGKMSAEFDLATEIDRLAEVMGSTGFGEVDRGTLLQAILANAGQNIYKTDWTRLATERKDVLQGRLAEAVERTTDSMTRAIDFLVSIGVRTTRLLPYGLQLVLLSSFFDRQPNPTVMQSDVLSRWFWVSSFSAWFGGANPSRISALIDEFRDDLAETPHASELKSFDLTSTALPFPSNFDMRSARTRTLLLVMLAATPEEDGTDYVEFAINALASRGPSAVGHVFWSLPENYRGSPANRMFRAPSASRGSLASWILQKAEARDWSALESSCVPRGALEGIRNGDVAGFVEERQAALVRLETIFQKAHGVTPGSGVPSEAPIDTE